MPGVREQIKKFRTQAFDCAHDFLMVRIKFNSKLLGGQLTTVRSCQAIQHFLWKVLHIASSETDKSSYGKQLPCG